MNGSLFTYWKAVESAIREITVPWRYKWFLKIVGAKFLVV